MTSWFARRTGENFPTPYILVHNSTQRSVNVVDLVGLSRYVFCVEIYSCNILKYNTRSLYSNFSTHFSEENSLRLCFYFRAPIICKWQASNHIDYRDSFETYLVLFLSFQPFWACSDCNLTTWICIVVTWEYRNLESSDDKTVIKYISRLMCQT